MSETHEKVDYGKTLNLPKTDFPMRGELPKREPETLKKWNDNKIYEKALAKNKGNKSYILHDGPPYANGDIHTGHALNKILKDILIRYKTMKGFYSPYVPGWDTHGLPIERKVQQTMKINKDEVGIAKFRELCKEYALKQVDTQRNQMIRLGNIGDWENPYLTLDPEFESKQIEVFGEMYKKGYIYKGLKPVYWCSDCETALAEAEIEYNDDKVKSIFVKFKLEDDKGLLNNNEGNIYFVIWTTTTWTLPGNVAITVNPEFEYSLVKVGKDILVMAKELVESVMSIAKIEEYTTVMDIMGSDLENMVCRHPFLDRSSRVILGSPETVDVRIDTGTGCVHTAPGHGMEDYLVCNRYKDIEIVVPVDEKGYMTEEAGQFSGMHYSKANDAIFDYINETGSLLAYQSIEHQYPHCWRCKEPVIYRATSQWFASVEDFKQETLEQIKKVDWIPAWGEERIANMVESRSDWCISRQRVWGVPIPIFYCNECDKELINEETIDIVKDLFKAKGSNSWFEMTSEEILGNKFKCECGHDHFKKETDIMDVWFDSGSSHMAVLETRENLQSPADMYLEGNDQYRGWFQSSILTSVAVKGIAPYKAVITHGMVVDGEGKKMSKSLGNGIDPIDIVNEYGADILRLWTVSSDYHNDIRLSKEILVQMSEVYRKIRNTMRFMIGNLNDFDVDTNYVPFKNREDELNKWAMLKINKLIQNVTSSFEEYDYHLVYSEIHKFCVIEMSNMYLDVVKDRLYTLRADNKLRRETQSSMYDILLSLAKMLSPILVYTMEEIWEYMPHSKNDNAESVLLADWPEVNTECLNSDLEEKWDKIAQIKIDIAKALEEARAAKVIGSSLAAKVIVTAPKDKYDFINNNKELFNLVCITSGFEVREGNTLLTEIANADGKKCERCWMFSKEVGEDSSNITLCKKCVQNI